MQRSVRPARHRGSATSSLVQALQPLEQRVHLHAAGIGHTALRHVHRFIDSLSEARVSIGGATLGDRVFFAGGYAGPTSDVVDIYNTKTGHWTTAKLSNPRGAVAGAAVGGKVIFAGGYMDDVKVSAVENTVDVADVYDSKAGRWSVEKIPNRMANASAAVVGPLAIFVGGSPLSDPAGRGQAVIYDSVSGRWSTQQLPEPAGPSASAVIGNKALFLADGGNALDIYDGSTGRWSSLPAPLGSSYGSSAAASGTDAVFYNQDGLFVFDTITERWQPPYPTPPEAGLSAVSLGGRAVFAGGFVVDLSQHDAAFDTVRAFDARTGRWSMSSLSQARDRMGATVVGRTAVFAGGEVALNSDAVTTVDSLVDSTPAANLAGGLTSRPGGRAQDTILNSGDAAFAGPYDVSVYAMPLGQYHGAVLLGSVRVTGTIPRGGSVAVRVPTHSRDAGPAGAYHLVAMVTDSHGREIPVAGGSGRFVFQR